MEEAAGIMTIVLLPEGIVILGSSAGLTGQFFTIK